MQNTRLNRFFDQRVNQLGTWLRNPWRRVSVLLISLLLGNFLGGTISTVSGQRAELDIWMAAVLVVITEVVNRVVYGTPPQTARSLLVQITNALKIGLVYSLFVEAFKLGS